jgi:carbonic anhydrase
VGTADPKHELPSGVLIGSLFRFGKMQNQWNGYNFDLPALLAAKHGTYFFSAGNKHSPDCVNISQWCKLEDLV